MTVFQGNCGGPLVLIGTYTNYEVLPHYPTMREGWGPGVVSCRWSRGRLQPVNVTPVLNPAFMKYHPTRNVLYVLSECINTEGYLTAFRVDPATGALTEVGRVSMTGKSTCYISFDRHARHAVITNYWDGRIDVVALDEEGIPLRVVHTVQQTRRETWRQVVDRPDHMANRQDGPHAHCNVFHPSGRWVFVPDLGDNAIFQYGYDEATGALTPQAHCQLDAGDGPRHFVFHPTLPYAYSGCELLSQVAVFDVDSSEPDAVKLRIRMRQRLSTLPDGWAPAPGERNYVGEIKIDADGRFLYVSNRGHNSIAAFAIDQVTGTLSRVSIDSTLGRCPRHFGISPCGSFVVVGVQDSDCVKVFRRCPNTGSLSFAGAEVDVPAPCFVCFITPHATGDPYSVASSLLQAYAAKSDVPSAASAMADVPAPVDAAVSAQAVKA